MDLVVAKFQTMMNSRQTPPSQFSAATPFEWFGYFCLGCIFYKSNLKNYIKGPI